MPIANFNFLSERWPILSQLGELAERNVYLDPNTTLFKLRLFGEKVVSYIYAFEDIQESLVNNQDKRINFLKNNDLIDDNLSDMFHSLRKSGNIAVHEGLGTESKAITLLSIAYKIGTWFMQTYGDWSFEADSYSVPLKEDLNDNEIQKHLKSLSEEYEKKVKLLEDELNQIRAEKPTQEQVQKRRKHARETIKKVELNEDETRVIIDDKLNQCGWEADTTNLRWAKGTRPEKGRNLAIAEWYIDPDNPKSKRADYALFIGEKLYGIIEAKRFSKDIVADLEKSKMYSREIRLSDSEAIGPSWDKYRVPFLFATNGRPYLKQLEGKSGIWFLDARINLNHPRVLQDWYSPQGLLDLMEQDSQKANAELEREPFDYMMDSSALGLRDYQVKAIKCVEEAIISGNRTTLLAMATGTGKTRTIIGLVYRLVKTKRFKRILFLVDRNALGEQARDSFYETPIKDFSDFDEIYDMKELKDKIPDKETKLHISTVQGMVKRILYSGDNEDGPTVDWYDCIIVDEAHRGYLLDREMSEDELIFRDQADYISKYRTVLEFFDAVKIGMTATPAQQTVEIFGKPVFTYSYREAVIDGWLVDHEPPHKLKTHLSEEGIKFKKGEVVPVYNPETGEITNSEELPDEVLFEIDKFNTVVLSENFNRAVLNEIAQNIDLDGNEKTLVFACTDDHADDVVRFLKEEYEKIGVLVDDDAIIKITGSIDKPSQMIRKFKNEKYPSIVVTVDLLTTGIDVPEICNLVFMRRVRSRILYEQMMGRATRRADHIEKTHFNIFDAVGLYENMQKVSTMKPVVAKPEITFEELIDEMQMVDSDAKRKVYVEQIIAKFNRKLKRFSDDETEKLGILTDGKTPQEFLNYLKNTSPDILIDEFNSKPRLVDFLDENIYRVRKQMISYHEDYLKEHSRGYGTSEKPEDYLEEFGRFIKDNINKIPALQIVAQRPKELTRKELKSLKIQLDELGFNETVLNTAYHQLTNEQIVEDIIGFIRQQALGNALMGHEQRIRNAMNKIENSKVWNVPQKKWLDRIEKQLLLETVIDRESFEQEPFKQNGGYDRINKIFEGQLGELLKNINEKLYEGRAS